MLSNISSKNVPFTYWKLQQKTEAFLHSLIQQFLVDTFSQMLHALPSCKSGQKQHYKKCKKGERRGARTDCWTHFRLHFWFLLFRRMWNFASPWIHKKRGRRRVFCTHNQHLIIATTMLFKHRLFCQYYWCAFFSSALHKSHQKSWAIKVGLNSKSADGQIILNWIAKPIHS